VYGVDPAMHYNYEEQLRLFSSAQLSEIFYKKPNAIASGQIWVVRRDKHLLIVLIMDVGKEHIDVIPVISDLDLVTSDAVLFDLGPPINKTWIALHYMDYRVPINTLDTFITELDEDAMAKIYDAYIHGVSVVDRFDRRKKLRDKIIDLMNELDSLFINRQRTNEDPF